MEESGKNGAILKEFSRRRITTTVYIEWFTGMKWSMKKNQSGKTADLYSDITLRLGAANIREIRLKALHLSFLNKTTVFLKALYLVYSKKKSSFHIKEETFSLRTWQILANEVDAYYRITQRAENQYLHDFEKIIAIGILRRKQHPATQFSFCVK